MGGKFNLQHKLVFLVLVKKILGNFILFICRVAVQKCLLVLKQVWLLTTCNMQYAISTALNHEKIDTHPEKYQKSSISLIGMIGRT